jgi:hypothetical protein
MKCFQDKYDEKVLGTHLRVKVLPSALYESGLEPV